MADDERRHGETFKRLTGRDVPRDNGKILWHSFLGVELGSFVIGLIAKALLKIDV